MAKEEEGEEEVRERFLILEGRVTQEHENAAISHFLCVSAQSSLV